MSSLVESIHLHVWVKNSLIVWMLLVSGLRRSSLIDSVDLEFRQRLAKVTFCIIFREIYLRSSPLFMASLHYQAMSRDFSVIYYLPRLMLLMHK